MAIALRRAAPLKPEIRLAQALSEYEAILTDSQKTTFRTWRSASPPSVSDVMKLTAEIDTSNSNRKSRRCFGPRLTNVLEAVQQFTTVVDIIVGGSQSLIASAIWGTLKMTLQITSRFSSYFDNLSTLFMSVGRSCPRYQEFASLYPRSTQLQNALCQYFVVVVELCKASVLFISKPFFAQLSTTILKPFQSEFGHFEGALSKLANAIREEASLASTQQLSIEAKDNSNFRTFMGKFSNNVSQDLREAKAFRSQRMKVQFLDACSTYNHQTGWKRARRAGTSSWIYDKQEFCQWAQGPSSSVLWCTGILGSGKTVLTAGVVEYAMTRYPNAFVSYFFCNYDDAESLKGRTIIGAVARQFLSYIKPEEFGCIEMGNTAVLEIDQVIEHLRMIIPSEQQDYFIILDGLDECSEMEMRSLFGYLERLLASMHRVRLFCASRPNWDRRLCGSIRPQYIVSMSQGNPEIAQYIESALEERLESGSLCLGDPTIILAIRDALLKGSQGMFLWVVFQLDSVCAEATDEAILDVLQNLPKDLPETFDRILQRLGNKRTSNPGLCKDIFKLVAAARRPLTLDELREALSVVPGDTHWNPKKLINDMHTALTGCGSLLVVDEEDYTVHFAHHSVQQYLVSAPLETNTGQYHVDLPNADLTMGEICVTYLNYGVFDRQLSTIPTQNLPQQTDIPSSIIGSTLHGSAVRKIALKVLKSRPDSKFDLESGLKAITEQLGRHKGTAQSDHVFLPYAQENWLFHSKRFERQKQASYHLWLQLVEGQTDIVELPWPTGRQFTITKEVLMWASENQHGALFRTMSEGLWEKQRQMASPRSTTSILTSIQPYAPAYDMIFDKILEGDPNVGSIFYDTTLLAAAAVFGNTAVVSILLNKGIGVDSPDAVNALIMAIDSKQVEVVKLLLSQEGIQVNARTETGSTPLNQAILAKNKDIVKLLLTRSDIDINLPSSGGYPPLLHAVFMANEQVVKLLLDRADTTMINLRHVSGQTALHIAAELGREGIVELLLERQDLNTNIEDNGGKTALHRAVFMANTKVVKPLLDRADTMVNLRNISGQTALHIAAEPGREGAIELLLRRQDININIEDDFGKTALHHAVLIANTKVVKLLLDRADTMVNLRNFSGQTALHIAAERGREGIVELLLERQDINVNIQDNRRITPLHHAARVVNEKMVKLLLDRADTMVNLRNFSGQTALHIAAKPGREGAVELLLKRQDININIEDNGGMTALHRAVLMANTKVVKLLLDRADTMVNLRNISGQTALHTAAECGREGAVELLLERQDISVDIEGQGGMTPLEIASTNGHRGVVTLLKNYKSQLRERVQP